MNSQAQLDVGQMLEKAAEFRVRFESAKASVVARDFEWYPYDSLANLVHLEALLHGANRFPLELAAGAPVLDVGCADGELSFFFEWLGCEVHAVDHPATNHNGMRGVRALKEALGSRIEIYSLDLDGQFALPPGRYGLGLFLGTLYHLKNPFYALEALSRQVDHCLLSTRIARQFPGVPGPVRDIPLAYLLHESELNQDDSNYWIFSEAALRRVLKRAHWDVKEFMTTGARSASDPVSLDRDERAFCLAKSRFGLANVELLAGWHDAEGNGWRWTERRFSLRAEIERPGHAARLRFRFFVPDALIERWGSLRLSASANGRPLPSETYSSPGNHAYERVAPAAVLQGAAVEVAFTLDKWLPPGDADPRELGVIAAEVSLLE